MASKRAHTRRGHVPTKADVKKARSKKPASKAQTKKGGLSKASHGIKHPGAATAAAKREGLSVHAWAEKHKHDPGTTGKRARLALTFEKHRK
jgi:hypothetical protein